VFSLKIIITKDKDNPKKKRRHVDTTQMPSLPANIYTWCSRQYLSGGL